MTAKEQKEIEIPNDRIEQDIPHTRNNGGDQCDNRGNAERDDGDLTQTKQVGFTGFLRRKRHFPIP